MVNAFALSLVLTSFGATNHCTDFVTYGIGERVGIMIFLPEVLLVLGELDAALREMQNHCS